MKGEHGIAIRATIVILVVAVSSFRLASCLNRDGFVLLSLSKGWVLPEQVSGTWNVSDATPCMWRGVLCNRLHRVVSINMSQVGVSGKLVSEIGLLAHLQEVDLAGNNLSGEIPATLGNCTELVYLDLSMNFLSGPIPDSFGRLTRLSFLSLYGNFLNNGLPRTLFQLPLLETLYLNQNNFSGIIPDSIGNLTRLRVAWLSDNRLFGVLPESIGNCTQLTELYLFNNQLVGSLPPTLNRISGLGYVDVHRNRFSGRVQIGDGGCGSLNVLILSFNSFSGQIPMQLGNCSELVALAMVDNSLSGSIPASFGSLTKLSQLYLSKNQLSGAIPPEIGNCASLTDLQINENQLRGRIPCQIGKLTNLRILSLFINSLDGGIPPEILRIPTLEVLFLYNNNLSGEVPPELAETKMLRNLSLFNNRLSGALPPSFGSNSSLQSIDLTNNQFTGFIPTSICLNRKLKILDLGHNFFNGSIPLEVGKCTSLTRMILSNNNLSGSLPEFSKNCGLSYMDITGNLIEGAIPPSIRYCTNLTSINLSSNKLNGILPQELGNLRDLRRLVLSHNNLRGQLPVQISNCKELYLLDVGFNSLSGLIPSSLAGLNKMQYLMLQENRFTGGIPEFLSAFGRLLELQLGGNMLGGGIPPSLGEIQSLDIGLNISCNGLVGQIPLQLGQLYKLQSLDISLNNLTGNLSPLVGLQSLLEVNVSHNHFIGAIPHSWVKFLNFSPTSFLGNSGLCIPCLQDDIICDKGSILARCKATKSDHTTTRVMVLAIVLGAIFLSVLLLTVVKLLPRSHPHPNVAELQLQEGPSSMLNRVMEATGNLNQQYIIGRGAHGTIYKVEHGLGKPYVVKKIDFKGRKGLNRSMMKEIQTLGSIKHRNLLKLENFWFRDSHGLILYDFMENGSLHDVLHEVSPSPLLEWNVRYRIALGIAQGLAYLHHDCIPAIIHRDIKPKNVLLDSEMEPHISDFGTAKLMKLSSTGPPSSSVVGTPGYMAPEVAFSTLKSKESDVYSYGVLLLELLTRKKALDPSFGDDMDIVGWVNATVISSNKVIDPCLTAEFLDSSIKEEVSKMLLIAMRCTTKDPSGRPRMRGVVKKMLDIKATKLEYNDGRAEDLRFTVENY
ncbi:Receptor-like protein kinase [Nymphaea thermarum]|nr:Receptor-like protein kinase [Nymphaea thermarum]